MVSAKTRTGTVGLLSRGWWAGLGVIVTIALTVLGFYLSSGNSTSYSNHGGCVAQGNNNTVSCRGTGSDPRP